MCAKSLQSRLTLCDPTDCSPRISSVHGILQARILEWEAISSSRGSSRPSVRTRISYVSGTGRQVLYHRRHLARPEGETDVQRREMTYSRSPARWSQGPDQSPRPLTPQAPWRSSYVEFPREHISVSRNTPKSTGIKQRGPLVPSPSCDDQKVWHWGPGRQGCLGCSQRERYTHTHTHTHTHLCGFRPHKISSSYK